MVGSARRTGGGARSPLERLLVPLDGSEAARRILSSPLLCAPETTVMLVRVLRAGFGGQGGSQLEDAIADLVKARRDLVRRGARVGFRILAGEPLAELQRFAWTFGPSLVCVSLDARTGWRRSRAIVEGLSGATSAPLLVARLGRTESLEIVRVLVPVDGNEAAAPQISLAAAVARRCGAQLVLCHVAEPAPPAEARADPAPVSVLRERLGLVGVSIEVVGVPDAEAIPEVAKAERAALLSVIVTDGRRRPPSAKIPLGRVFTRRLPCHVLVSGAGLPAKPAEPAHVVCGVD